MRLKTITWLFFYHTMHTDHITIGKLKLKALNMSTMSDEKGKVSQTTKRVILQWINTPSCMKAIHSEVGLFINANAWSGFYT